MPEPFFRKTLNAEGAFECAIQIKDCELNNFAICILSSFVSKRVVSVRSVKLINSRP